MQWQGPWCALHEPTPRTSLAEAPEPTWYVLQNMLGSCAAIQ